MEQLCVLIYEASESEQRVLHDVLAAYSITRDTEIVIKWLKTSAKENEIISACTEAQLAFVNTLETERAIQIGKLLYQSNPGCALVYYGQAIPNELQKLAAYFISLFPARPVLYLDRPKRQDYYHAMDVCTQSDLRQKTFVWETRGMRYRLPYGSILYFRSERNHIYIRLKNGTEHTFLGKLSNVEQLVPAQIFIRIHQSYLVNRAEILLIDKGRKAVRLSSGEDIFISKAHYRNTLEI